ncbi:MAG: hypothetical protein Q9P14_12865 [candidate division KSB1 bacterium]|nr:hypothetical protein [candidate division KSB1 bacterium]
MDWRLLIFDNGGGRVFFQGIIRVRALCGTTLPRMGLVRIRAAFIENDFPAQGALLPHRGRGTICFSTTSPFGRAKSNRTPCWPMTWPPPAIPESHSETSRCANRWTGCGSLPLKLTLLVPSDTVKAGQPIRLKLRIRNQATHAHQNHLSQYHSGSIFTLWPSEAGAAGGRLSADNALALGRRAGNFSW